MAKKLEVKEVAEVVDGAEKALYAYAEYEVQGRLFSIGEKFTPPYDWKRNLAQEELLLATKQKSGAQVGVVFSYPGEIINPSEKNPELRERRIHNVILPLEER